ncbi:M20/M25/M40 family metallo-hydrolase [Longimicrobium sp.]|uniref:M20/M25/M40 family metallo-hydrolase n=1 Tax=Longimicrobium sp. TaxID=2029185 RepID=UPI002BFD96E6|nr:M20/M25/M40 family metallo-hydrolase [Longimicrobium sp.]HSU14503.1 M20/M25/M40 family metallo-hydrolase [Longimicrobium sp.]
MRAPLSISARLLPFLAIAACARGPAAPGVGGPGAAAVPARTQVEDVRREMYALADDSMQGRYTGSPGMERAARYLAGIFREIGVQPAGEDGYFQRMPLAWTRQGGERVPRLLGAWADTAAVPAADRAVGINVVGIVPGTDPELREQVVLIDAHYDHLGTAGFGYQCHRAGADTVCNGADDDASGDVAVLEIARELRRGPPPKRTVIFLLTTGEEVGLLGTRWYIQHPARPLERMVANMEIEMIGRPDSLAGGGGRAWLTGFERSTMGEMLASAGIPIVADPRPGEHFFERSDNIAFAQRGIPAHTLSSFNLHGDYHTAADGPERIDYEHMLRVVRAAAGAARLLADGPAPVWKPGGRP